MIMKKWLSHFAYNQRSRSGWTFSSHLKNTSKSNLIGQKTVTYVPGTFVTLVPGPNKRGDRGRFSQDCYCLSIAHISAEGSLEISTVETQSTRKRPPKLQRFLEDDNSPPCLRSAR